MVRFIIAADKSFHKSMSLIYIPIWLDLLLVSSFLYFLVSIYLHSNMVRFIMFTLNRSSPAHEHLHSNMVRFIMYI